VCVRACVCVHACYVSYPMVCSIPCINGLCVGSLGEHNVLVLPLRVGPGG